MKLFKVEDLNLLPYNYSEIKDFEVTEQTLQGKHDAFSKFPSEQYATESHTVNFYYYKPISKYLNAGKFK